MDLKSQWQGKFIPPLGELKGKVLVCPLNWGLGHATRCVPIIRELLARGCEVVVAADGYPLAFLQQAFPALRFIELPSYSIRYSKSNSQILAMVVSLPRVMAGIVREHLWLKSLIKNETFDYIISDNRFGMWHLEVHSIYITHQMMIKMPRGLTFLENTVWKIHQLVITKYNQCWIPDLAADGGLTHDLAHRYPLPVNARFIGSLSRFDQLTTVEPDTSYQILVLISGIEPQRTLFEQAMIRRFTGSSEKVLILTGQPSYQPSTLHKGNITLLSHLEDDKLAASILGAEKIISRSGYSTIMDLYALGCLHKAELIPTPGQTEQEYLATVHP
jgi:uncharacterized protein (TIGR00661 family)